MKTSQLQIRISPAEKRYLQLQAEREGITVSEWVLKIVGATKGLIFIKLVEQIAEASGADEQAAFAALSDYLGSLKKDSFVDSVPPPQLEPKLEISPKKLALIASMVEYAAGRVLAPVPSWTSNVPPLEDPLFMTSLQSLRPYLLLTSPVQFKRRNIFIDSSVGGRV